MAESAGPEPAQLHDSASFAQVSRGPVSVAQLDQSALNYSGGLEEKSLAEARALSQHHPSTSVFAFRALHLLSARLRDQSDCISGSPVALSRRATAFICLQYLKSDKILRYITVRVDVNIFPDLRPLKQAFQI